MNLRDVLLHALNHQAVTGCAFNKDALDDEVVALFEQNGVDVDGVVAEVADNEDGHLDLF